MAAADPLGTDRVGWAAAVGELVALRREEAAAEEAAEDAVADELRAAFLPRPGPGEKSGTAADTGTADRSGYPAGW